MKANVLSHWEKSQTIFTVLFVFNLCAGLFVMLVLPHLFPAGHLGKGLFIGDSTSIHAGALRVLEAWGKYGPAPSLLLEHPAMYDWIVAAVYLFFPANPLSFLPVQAFSMALAGTLFHRLLLKIGFTKTASVCGALWLAANPQTFEWSTQLLKDGIFLAAILLCLTALFTRDPKHAIILFLPGCLMILILRPHWIRVLLLIIVIFVTIKAAGLVIKKNQHVKMVPWSNLLICLFIIGFLYVAIQTVPAPYYAIFGSYEATNRNARVSFEENGSNNPLLPIWERGRSPEWLSNRCFEIYNLRAKRILIGGHSLIDENTFLNSVPKQVAYLPRALQIGLFAPFPIKMWLGIEDGRKDPQLKAVRDSPQDGLGYRTTRVARKFMPWLTLLCSLALVGAALAMGDAQKRSWFLWLMLFCLPQLILLTMVCPNLGTLVRLRYPFYAILVCAGLACWIDFIKKTLKNAKPM